MDLKTAEVIVNNFVLKGSVYTWHQFFEKWKSECVLPKSLFHKQAKIKGHLEFPGFLACKYLETCNF
jgi:hypothetical protein